MGLDPTEYIEGTECEDCWGEGKTFGDFPTPKKVLVTFRDVGGGYESYNGSFLLEQFLPDVCIFWYEDNERYMFWDAARAQVAVYDWAVPEWIFDDIQDPCSTHFINDYGAIGGTANVE